MQWIMYRRRLVVPSAVLAMLLAGIDLPSAVKAVVKPDEQSLTAEIIRLAQQYMAVMVIAGLQACCVMMDERSTPGEWNGSGGVRG